MKCRKDDLLNMLRSIGSEQESFRLLRDWIAIRVEKNLSQFVSQRTAARFMCKKVRDSILFQGLGHPFSLSSLTRAFSALEDYK